MRHFVSLTFLQSPRRRSGKLRRSHDDHRALWDGVRRRRRRCGAGGRSNLTSFCWHTGPEKRFETLRLPRAHRAPVLFLFVCRVKYWVPQRGVACSARLRRGLGREFLKVPFRAPTWKPFAPCAPFGGGDEDMAAAAPSEGASARQATRRGAARPADAREARSAGRAAAGAPKRASGCRAPRRATARRAAATGAAAVPLVISAAAIATGGAARRNSVSQGRRFNFQMSKFVPRAHVRSAAQPKRHEKSAPARSKLTGRVVAHSIVQPPDRRLTSHGCGLSFAESPAVRR